MLQISLLHCQFRPFLMNLTKMLYYFERHVIKFLALKILISCILNAIIYSKKRWGGVMSHALMSRDVMLCARTSHYYLMSQYLYVAHL
jgi:hypothetical protein